MKKKQYKNLETVSFSYKKTVSYNGNHGKLRRQNKVPYVYGCQIEKYTIRLERKMGPVGVGPWIIWKDVCNRNLLECPNEQESGLISSAF